MTVAYNLSFWERVAMATGGFRAGNVPFYIGIFLIVTLFFNFLLSLFSFRAVLKPLLVVLFLVTSLASYFMNTYGAQLDQSMIQNVFETDARESFELISVKLVMVVVLLGIAPALLVAGVPVNWMPPMRSVLFNLAAAAGSLLLAGVVVMVCFKSLAPMVREHRELRYLLAPTNYLRAVKNHLAEKWKVPVVVEPRGLDAKKGGIWAGNARRTVTVIVVGETARAANFSLNGYARDTTPALARVPGLLNFTDVQSCGTATAVSLPCVFSLLGREGYSHAKARSQEGLLDVIKHAGFAVLWRNNNSGCKGVCDRVEYEDLSQPVPGDPLCNKEECYDERLLQGLPELIRSADKDLVVVLHQKGSHGPAYWKRYPDRFKRFAPMCETTELEKCSRESIVAAYDNTILYTDYFLNKTIELLSSAAVREKADTSLLYFSDHGESLGEANMYLHGAPYLLSPKEQRHVPMMVWMSEGFSKRLRIDRECLAQRTRNPYTHDNVVHSVLGMLRIDTSVYNGKLDLFQGCQLGQPAP